MLFQNVFLFYSILWHTLVLLFFRNNKLYVRVKIERFIRRLYHCKSDPKNCVFGRKKNLNPKKLDWKSNLLYLLIPIDLSWCHITYQCNFFWFILFLNIWLSGEILENPTEGNCIVAMKSPLSASSDEIFIFILFYSFYYFHRAFKSLIALTNLQRFGYIVENNICQLWPSFMWTRWKIY